MSKPSLPIAIVRFLIGFALFAHAMWFFGNLYEEMVIVPNGVSATVAKIGAFNAYFSVARQYNYYVPLTQLGTLALVAAAIGWRHEARLRLRVPAAASVLAFALTAFIIVHYNLRIWTGAVSALSAAELHSLVWQWGVANLLRIVLVGGAALGLLRARDVLAADNRDHG
jgi:hypothetical protein